jgi:tol-pal system protein YbgF
MFAGYVVQRKSLSLLALAGLLCVGSAHAGLFEDDEARLAIKDLRVTTGELRSQVDANRKLMEQSLAEEGRRAAEENTSLRKGLLESQNQVELLRSELAKLRGQYELLARDLSEAQRKQKDDLQGLDDRLRKFEPVKVSQDGKEFLADPMEKRDFDAALAIFRRGEFDRAHGAFVDFLNRYGPSSGYRASALFWLGNAQYAVKDYKEAIANFRSLISAAPDHMRVPESMLAISNCQLEMKDAKGARKSLEELVKAYPATEAGQAAKERLSRLK